MKYIILILALLPCYFALAQNSIVACYPFNGNANDISGNNNNGTVNGALLAADRFNNSNSAYFFNGSSDIITFSPVNFYLNEYTYSVWCKPVAIPGSTNYGSIFSIGGNSNDQVILVGNDASLGNIGFACGTWGYSNVFAHCYVGTQPSINDWHHIVFTRSNVMMKMFVDGQLICSQPTGANASYSGAPVIGSIGARAQSGIQSFNGLIDDITVYNGALTDSQSVHLEGMCENVGLPSYTPSSLNVNYNSTNNTLSLVGEANNFKGIYDVTLFNSIGQIILKTTFNLNLTSTTNSIVLSENLNGVFVLNIEQNKELILSKKIYVY